MADINEVLLSGHTTSLHCNRLLTWGDLFGIIEKEEGLVEVDVKFYLAEITSGLNDLHSLRFVHCNMKPENILISRSRHVSLVDFGVAV